MTVDAKRLAERILRAAVATCGIVLSAMPSTEAQTPFYQASVPDLDGVAPIGTKAPGDAGALVHDRIGS
jgi:hypothetical protein